MMPGGDRPDESTHEFTQPPSATLRSEHEVVSADGMIRPAGNQMLSIAARPSRDHSQMVNAGRGLESNAPSAGSEAMRELGLEPVGDTDEVFIESANRQSLYSRN